MRKCSKCGRNVSVTYVEVQADKTECIYFVSLGYTSYNGSTIDGITTCHFCGG